MGRAGAPSSSKKDAEASAEDKIEELESKRLRDLAFSRGLLSRSKANPAHPLTPSKSILKCDGKDIVKKGTRKNKYLFAFPGLMAPVAGGKFGQLTHLDSRNPVLYVDFPQGRLKLFGTIVYPKNKYLVLHFLRGAGNILCEDCFESLVVFSACWWIGTEKENPEELQLDWPRELQQGKHADFDFTAGAGWARDSSRIVVEQSLRVEKDEPMSPVAKFKLERFEESSEEDGKQDVETEKRSLPVRQSVRTAGKKLKYVDTSSEGAEDGDDSSSSESQKILTSRTRKEAQKHGETPTKVPSTVAKSSGGLKVKSEVDAPISLDGDDEVPKEAMQQTSASAAQRTLTSQIEMTTTKASEGVLTSSGSLTGPRIATVLKQSTLKTFVRKKEEHPNLTLQESTPRKGRKASLDAIQGSSKRTIMKTPKKSPLKDDEEDASPSSSEEDSYSEKITPSKGKDVIKIGKQAINMKASIKKPKNSASKAKKSKMVDNEKSSEEDNDKGTRQRGRPRGKKRAEPSPKGRSPARSKRPAVKSVPKVSESDEDLAYSEEASNDSDEDWVG